MAYNNTRLNGVYERLSLIQQRLNCLHIEKNNLSTCMDQKEYLALLAAIRQIELLLIEQRKLIYQIL